MLHAPLYAATRARMCARAGAMRVVPHRHSASDTLRKTLQLPKTAFPMRGNLVKREPQLYDDVTGSLYEWQARTRAGRRAFVLHDGPPYANGALHTGHALNKILKDIICRYRLLCGDRIHFRPGWDMHGLPIELKALSRAKRGRGSNDAVEVRRLARETALDALETQRASFQRWNVMADWKEPYRTLDPAYERAQLHVFGALVREGLIYRGEKPVYWSPSTQTALAEAELEYVDNHESRSVFVKFPLAHPSDNEDLPASWRNALESGDGAVGFMAWTTTPWTLPANVALAVHPESAYVVVALNDGSRAIVAADRVEPLQHELAHAGIALVPGLPPVAGRALVGLTCEHPFDASRESRVYAATHVTGDSGTGVVHTAPGHGADDYALGRREGLDVLSPVDAYGRFTEAAGSALCGLPVLGEGNEAVVRALSSSGKLVGEHTYRHRYPYDWRSKKPVILRTTPQWFARVDKVLPAANRALDDVKFVPASAEARLRATLGARTDWCISRQRAWGVPIPVFYDEDGNALLSDRVIDHVKDIVGKFGSDCWWTMEDTELLPEEFHPAACGKVYRRGMDTLDVWFDSGSSWAAFASEVDDPLSAAPVADVYLEGSDQHRGWFQSSLLTSVATRGEAPFRTLITHGFVLDERGRKMSKSLGNVVNPDQIVSRLGAEVLRWWCASSDYTEDVGIGDATVQRAADSLRKIRNTARFALGCLGTDAGSSSDGAPPTVSIGEMPLTDRYMLHAIATFVSDVRAAYDAHAFLRAAQTISRFASVELSSFYYDAIKDRVYAGDPASVARRSAMVVLRHAVEQLVFAMAPILPHTAQDIFSHMTTEPSNEEERVNDVVFHHEWPLPPGEWKNGALADDFGIMLDVRGKVNAVLERMRREQMIGSGVDATLVLRMPRGSPIGAIASAFGDDELADLFVVSEARIAFDSPRALESPCAGSGRGATSETVIADDEVAVDGLAFPIRIEARAAPATARCDRCWKRRETTAPVLWEGSSVPLCARCSSVLESLR